MAVILPSVYKDGTATVNNGSTTVTGQNTLFVNSVLPGDFFGVHRGSPIRIASVDSNTSLTLANPWPEASQAAAPYEIMLQSDNARMQETSRQLLETLSSGNAYSLAQLDGSVDQIPIFSAPGTLTLLPKSEIYATAGDMRKTVYDPQNGQRQVAFRDNLAWELISSVDAPVGTTQTSWTNLSAFHRIKVTYEIIPDEGSIFGCRTSRNNGATWDVGANDYVYHGFRETDGSISGTNVASIGFIPLNTTYLGGNTAEGLVEVSFFNKLNLGSYHSECRFWKQSPGTHMSETMDGYIAVNGARNAIQFAANAGSYYGKLKLEGIRG